MPAVQLGADEIGHVDAVDRDIAEVAGDVHVDQPAVPDRDAGQVTVSEPGAAQVRGLDPGTAEPLAAAALASVEPVRPELRRLLRLTGRSGHRAGRIVGCCHRRQDNAGPRRSVPGYGTSSNAPGPVRMPQRREDRW